MMKNDDVHNDLIYKNHNKNSRNNDNISGNTNCNENSIDDF